MDMLEMAIKMTESIEKGVKPLIGWEKSDEVVKIGADGTPTKRIDLIAENIAINFLEKYGGAILISEEIGMKKIGNNEPEYIVVLDPIDGTYNALNDIPIYSVSVAMGKIKSENLEKYKNYDELLNNSTLSDLEVGVVKNIATGDIYYAQNGKGAYILKNGEKQEKQIRVSETKNLKDSSVGVFSYGLSPNTLAFIKDRKVRRIRLFGSIALEMSYVARGALDAFINVNETTRLCDIAAGYIIIKEAGGKITNKDGKPINLKLNVNEKTSLISSNEILHKKLVGIFGNKWIIKPTNFGIISRLDKEEAVELVIDVIKYLNSKNIRYSLDKGIYNVLKNKLKLMDKDIFDSIIPSNCDLIENIDDISHMISIGGDGTVLRASKITNGNEIPILCINMGTVGFLTEFSKEDVFKAIDEVINGNYEIEKRTKLMGFIRFKDGSQKILPDALNEVVVTTKNPAKMLHFEVYVNGNFVEDVRADGIIISTPNGSTAYSLSAGGPIVEPLVDGFIIVPICPFKLSSRPIVVDGNSEIKIKILKKSTLVVVDGDVEEIARMGDELILRKSDNYAYFVKGSNFYSKLKKLGLME
ncbi:MULTISPECIES: bifunctional NADP phosphatase/NAD kinase [Methanothermococcus]|jgi:NAD+ kinase|uniref:bifunctional NADP phosphatase/NAD kinase n=1 Tax=Methanothermococcus TaxID=155862 RepID=UPI00036869CC|nr:MULTISPECIES: bifunctional NADP phosphatase/NAD kinase [Methanothermococcus]